MAIPSHVDYKLGEIESLAAGVTTSLRTLRHSPADEDTALRSTMVRDTLRQFNQAVVDVANEILAAK